MKTGAVIYCRVSTQEQVGNFSLPTQQKACVEYCARQGLAVDQILVEEGESAKTINRPVFKRLLDYCRGHRDRIASVVVYSLNRFSRNNHDFHFVKAILAKDGVNLKSVTEPIDESPTGKLMEGILASFAQFDNDVRSERTKVGMTAALRAGRWTFQAPLGYTNVTENGCKSVQVDPERGHLIERAFSMAAEGVPLSCIASALAAAGLRGKRGHQISKQSLSVILRNPFYLGHFQVSGFHVASAGRHPALVDQEIFDRAQANLSQHRLIRYRPGNSFPLRRFIHCPECGRPFTGSRSRGRGGRLYGYYHCRSGCSFRVPQFEMETAFVEHLAQIRPTPEVVDAFTDLVREIWEEAGEGVELELGDLERDLAALVAQKDKLIDLYIEKAAIDLPTFQKKMDELAAKIGTTQEAIARIKIPCVGIEDLTDYAARSICSLSRVWSDATDECKGDLQRLLFPEGMVYREGTFEVRGQCAVLEVFEELKFRAVSHQQNPTIASPSNMVTPTGRSWNRILQGILDLKALIGPEVLPAKAS